MLWILRHFTSGSVRFFVDFERLVPAELIIKTKVEAMKIHYDIESDGLYLIGIEKGIEMGIQKVIELEKQAFMYKLWSLQELSLEKIAFLVGVSHERLLEMLRAQLQAGGQTELEANLTIEAYQARFM
jgi:hypothetical protein